MYKTNVQARFDTLVSDIWPEFKTLGYRKTGNNFRFYDSVGWGKVVNIQKSSFGNRDSISFTINTGLYLSKADTMFELPKAERFTEPDCLIRKRIGKLNNSQKDLWYDITEQTPTGTVEKQVTQDIRLFVLPYLDRIQSEKDILEQIVRERIPKSEEAIRALFTYGYSSEAYRWLEEEIATTIYTSWRNQLLKLKASLEQTNF